MPSQTPVVAVLVVAAARAALAFDSVYDISIRPRPSESQSSTHTGEITALSPQPALTLRLVDSGGVGVSLAGDWGKDYSHDLRVFREAILEKPPYVDDSAFARIGTSAT